MTPRSRSLGLETLEDRDVPSATVWGTPWPNADHLTLSFAPNGTEISGQSSTLSTVLANAGSNAQRVILSAFQTWADFADINLGLVADGGEAFGIGKAVEDDPRFGDIRVGAIPLDSSVLAVTSPFNYLSTYSGDMVFNAGEPIGTTYNLYAVALHEVGHALGLPDNNDPTSVMYQYYTGTNDTLSASDISAIQSLYGVRVPNTTSNTQATAANYTSPVYAELNSSTDDDYYRFGTGLPLTGTTIHLQAEGLSLLDAQVSVYNSRGNLIASTSATDPTNNDLTLKLNNLSSLSNYYVEVSSPNGGVFDVGSYELTIANNLSQTISDLTGGAVGLLNSVGHTLATATNLLPVSTLGDSFTTRASLNSGAGADMFQVQAPASGSAAMVVTAWSLGNGNLSPSISVYDSAGDSVASEVLTNNSTASIIQVLNPVAGVNYYVQISSATGQTGGYSVAVDFLSTAISFPMSASGTLNAAVPSTSANMVVATSQVMHFVLSAEGVPANPNTILMLTIVDPNGDTVATVQTTSGSAQSIDVFLQAGSYTVTVSVETANGVSPPDVGFELAAIGMTDPVSTPAANPTSTPAGSPATPSPTPPSSGSSTNGGSTSSTTSTTWAPTTPTGSATWN